MSTDNSDVFTGLFVHRLAEVELCALNEMRRLNEALKCLRAENQLLRQQLEEPNHERSDGKLHEQQVHEPRLPLVLPEQQVHEPRHRPVLSRWNERTMSATVNTEGFLARSIAGLTDFRDTPLKSVQMKRRHTDVTYADAGNAQRVARSVAFEYASFGLVMFNALWMAIDLDFNGKPLLESSPVFQAVEHFFVAVFSLEIVVRLLAFERKRMAFTNLWFVFDFSIVVMMILDSWLLTLVIVATGNSNLGGMNIISALRILRVLRIVRMLKICHFVPELETMVSSMLAGIRAVLIAGVILLAITYGFAIAMRSQGISTNWGDENFGSVPYSIYTLLVESMLPDNRELLGIISRESWWSGIIYAVFLLLSAITVLNMLVGMLVDVVSRVSAEETEIRNIEAMEKMLHSMLRSADSNYDGNVTRAEFDSIVADQQAVNLLYRVGVDVQTLVDEAEVIFSNRSHLSFEEFKKEVLLFRRTQTATLGAIMATRRVLLVTLEQIANRVTVLETNADHWTSL